MSDVLDEVRIRDLEAELQTLRDDLDELEFARKTLELSAWDKEVHIIELEGFLTELIGEWSLDRETEEEARELLGLKKGGGG